ncbi:MAG: U32 family peptidase [Methanoregula sp.]|nr:U32 family peptidase [Methanoregula sp.]
MRPSSQILEKNDLPELLAPAGSPEAFRAAVAAGADAVYLSGKKFGARKYAPNFTDTEISEAVRYAHCRDVRVYVTINTLIHDTELEGIAEYLIWLWSVGVDAVLVQDTGIAALAREIVPLLPLHASTQLTIHNTDGVRWAAEQGFSRVVLARELTLEEITRIAQETGESGIGLEVFAHGALCYCYSGQCLLSSVIGGRSGNRGMCAQPCRKPYTMITADSDDYGRPTGISELLSAEHYLLSPKDLCTYENLPKLVNSPVVSLKIEGRMKSPEYVSIVVSTYRKSLDAIAAGRPYKSPESLQDLCLAFNRGLTAGYLFGKRGTDLMGRDAPDHRGTCIGVVNRYDEKSKTARISSRKKQIPCAGDGLLFTHPKNPRHGFGFSLNAVPVQKDGEIAIKVPHPVEPGTMVFITSSAAFEIRARQIIAHPAPGLRHPVPVDVHVRIDSEGKPKLDVLVHSRICGEIRFTYHPDINLVPARSRPLTHEQIELHLKKTGDTPFTIRNFTLAYDGGLFIPIARLNRMRREFLGLAEEMMVARSRPPQKSVEQSLQRWNKLKSHGVPCCPGTGSSVASSVPVLGVYADSPEGVQGAVQGGCDSIYFEPVFTSSDRKCRIISGFPSVESQIIAASAMCREAGIRFILKFPRITRNNYLEGILPVLAKGDLDIAGFMVENYGSAHALLRIHPKAALFGSIGLNIFNHEAVCHLFSLFVSLTLSPELSHDEIGLLIRTARSQGCSTLFAIIGQGNSEAMVSEDCVLQPWFDGNRKNGDPDNCRFFGIRDTTGHIFPVRIDGECRSHIYNSSEICLINHLPSLMQIGVSEVIIDARGRTGLYASDMTCIYKDAITLVKNGIKTNDQRFSALKDAVKLRAIGGITSGHYIRGLKE